MPASRRYDSPEQEAFLSLWRTYDRLRALEDELFARFDLTPQQYNVLRLLKAEQPGGLPSLVIADRLVSRAPDSTRMFDKLEARGFVRRTRSATDRRTVRVEITPAGLALLDEIADPLRACHSRQLGHLSAADLQQLIALMQIVREPHEPPGSAWR